MSTKAINFIKRKHLLILTYIIPIILIIISVNNFYTEYYSIEKYEEFKFACEELNDEKSCAMKETIKELNDRFKSIDTKTFFFEILYHYIDNYIVVIGPLLVIIQTIYFLHKDFSSGFIKNKLTRMTYDKYKKSIYLTSLKSALILPFIIITIFTVSSIITKLNFTTPEWVYKTSVYNEINYNNFFIYILSSCLIIYFMGIFYSNIAIAFLNKSKNSLLVTIFSYLCFFTCIIFFDIGGTITLIKILKLNSSIGVYLNIFDYWHINGEDNYIYFIIIAFLLAIISHCINRIIYKNKEETIIDVEKENI